VADGAELEGTHHEKHGLYDFLSKAIAENFLIPHRSSFLKHCHYGSKVFYRANTKHTSFTDLSATLIAIRCAQISTS